MPTYSKRFRTERIDFETHLIYAELLEGLSNAVTISTKMATKLSSSDAKKLKEKIRLVKLTKKSIDQEYKIVTFDKEYSTASVLWLPIKTYYLIYHLICILECLLTGDLKHLSGGHSTLVSEFAKKLQKSDLEFSSTQLNLVFDKDILNFKSRSGEHLQHGVADDILYKLLMKKVAKEKVANFKITNALDARKRADKARIEKFTNGLRVSIFDYFYLMRLRTNYRNSKFIDDLPSKDTKVYFEKYYSTSCNFYSATTKLISQLMKGCK